MAVASLSLGKVYNFDMFAPGLLGAAFKNAAVLALMDRKTADKEIDTVALHVQFYPELDDGHVPDNPDSYYYVKIRTSAGIETVLGLAWIKPDSVEEVGARTITVTIENVGADDLPKVRDALRANGFQNIDLSISS